jgi:hypothetical protein
MCRCTGASDRAEAITQAPHQHRHVRPLAAAIGMQLVKKDEVEALRILDDGLVELVLPGHQQFEHHEIRQQDVGLGFADAHAFVMVFLAGVPREGRSQVFGKPDWSRNLWSSSRWLLASAFIG